MQNDQEDRDRSPTGSGDLDQGEFRLFVEILVELVILFRNERSAQYDLRSTQRDRASILHQLDEHRFELRLLQRHLRRTRTGNEVAESEANIRRLDQDLSRTQNRIQMIQSTQYRRQRITYETMQRLFKLEPAVINASFRPDYPNLSPLFYRRLRQARAGQDLIEIDERRARSKRNQLRDSFQSLIRASAMVLNSLPNVENGVAGARHTLGAAMSELHQVTSEHKRLNLESEYRDMILSTRTKSQQVLEMGLFLDIAAPVLEREKLVNRDRLRTSVLEENAPGEPAFILNEQPPELTIVQRETIRTEYRSAYDEHDRCDAIIVALTRRYWEDLADFKEVFPDCTRLDFDLLDARDRREAAQHLREVEDRELRAGHRGMEAGMVPRDHDYLSQPEDGNASVGSSGPENERAEQKQRRNIGIERWIDQAAEEAEQIDHQPYTAPLDYWNAREVGFQDKDRASNVSMRSNDRRLVKKWLEKYLRDCRDLREEVHGSGSETSSEASRWCC